MIVDGGQSEVGVESTVVTLAQKPARLLRPGGITAEQLKSVLRRSGYRRRCAPIC